MEPIQRAVVDLLLALGERPEREGLRDTPKRVAKALLFSLRGNAQSAAGALGGALFTEHSLAAAPLASEAVLSGSDDGEDVFELASSPRGGGGGLVVVRRIDLFSTGEDDLQPFFGHVHVAYVPAGGRLVGLSKTARIADVFARRLQTPQRLADELAAGLEEVASPRGVAVLLHVSRLRHFAGSACAACGLGGAAAEPRLYAARRGVFLSEPSWWNEFTALARLGEAAPPATPCACAAPAPQPAADCDARLRAAIAAMLAAAGEPAERPGLVEGVARYAADLRAATAGYVARAPALLPDSNAESNSESNAGCEEWWELALPLRSMCEHHLLPFFGCAHVALRAPPPRPPRAALQAAVDAFALRLQVQERLTAQVAEAVWAALGARAGAAGAGVAVLVEASHLCMASRGVEQRGSSTSSTACLGSYAGDAAGRAAFLRAAAGGGEVEGRPRTPTV